MKLFFFVMLWIVAGVFAPLQARDRERNAERNIERETQRQSHQNLRREQSRDDDGDRFAERRERMRALREEMLRGQPRPQPAVPLQSPFFRRDEELRRPPEGRELMRPPVAPARDAEGARRMSPEERREFRRKLHEAGRDAYRDQ